MLPQPDFFHTQLCLDFVRSGACQAGSHCRFAHNPHELRRSKTNTKRRGYAPNNGMDGRVISEKQRLKFLQEQLERLQAQVQALQAVGMSSGLGSKAETEQKLVPCDGSIKQPVSTSLWNSRPAGGHVHSLTLGWSRQTTQWSDGSEYCSSPYTSDDAWQDTISEAGPSEASLGTPQANPRVQSLDEQSEVPCRLVVTKTFFSLERLDTLGTHRTKSLPDLSPISDDEGQ